MRALFIEHDHVSPPGEVARRFEERGYEVTEHVVVTAAQFHSPGVEPLFPPVEQYDAVVAMGAPWSAYDRLVASWVTPELALLREARERAVPVLGICFGGQLLALAHGGSVAASPKPEIGWHDVQSDDDAVVPSGPWFQWHYDRWEVPPEATEIARNPVSSQAFVLDRSLAVQFHPELDSAMLTGWLANGGDVKLAEAGIDAEAVIRQTRDRAAQSAARSHRLVDGFLDRVAVSA